MEVCRNLFAVTAPVQPQAANLNRCYFMRCSANIRKTIAAASSLHCIVELVPSAPIASLQLAPQGVSWRAPMSSAGLSPEASGRRSGHLRHSQCSPSWQTCETSQENLCSLKECLGRFGPVLEALATSQLPSAGRGYPGQGHESSSLHMHH